MERWGSVITIRPEVQAYFKSVKPFEEWYNLAHWEFVSTSNKAGNWKAIKKNVVREWQIGYKELNFVMKLTKFKHLGLFPEQRNNWDIITEKLNDDDRLLNLFAYTGAASLVARKMNAEVTHVDSVKQLISWANQNMTSSKLDNIRWVHEDALKFLKREVKRGNRYNGLIMDPPAWGIGAKNEKWKIEDKIDELLNEANRLVVDDGLIILNTYSPKLTIKELKEIASLHLNGRKFSVKELWMKTSTGKDLYFGNVLRTG